MLTLSNLVVTTLTDPSTLTGTFTAFAEYRYDNICTNFSHDSSAQNFSGKALATGGLWTITRSSGSLVTSSSIVTAPPLTLTVGSNTFSYANSIAGSGHCSLTGGLSPLPIVSTLGTNPATSIAVLASMDLQLSLNTAVGTITGSFTAYRCGLDTLPSQEAPFSLVRGGSCGV